MDGVEAPEGDELQVALSLSEWKEKEMELGGDKRPTVFLLEIPQNPEAGPRLLHPGVEAGPRLLHPGVEVSLVSGCRCRVRKEGVV
ncbi:hypothetical protein EYF80_054391 [Liparis tanakae]|uniref:Uncharacterized protein n=1 Tax=Liparis tanakae TaxID=230148 RepID=A0A4Z2F441_9TELE|nr:hypothetical protein EYF80_054391 [Liparis tanakae]